MALSLADALGISEVQLPKQSVVEDSERSGMA